MKKSVFMIVLMSSVFALAEVKLPAILGDHMVLQRDAKVRIWGFAAPGEKVSVHFRKQQAVTQADAKGNWAVLLKPMRAGGPDNLTVIGKNTITLKDILVGEVWVCSGQSNMQYPVCASADSAKETAAANYPQIRLFTVTCASSAKPLNEVSGSWTTCTPQTVPGFSAVAYYFGRGIHKYLNIPIGLINASWGGTNAETWTPREGFAMYPALKSFSDLLELADKNMAAATQKYLEKYSEWAKATHKDDPGNMGFKNGWATIDANTKDWQTIELPGSIDALNGSTDFEGIAWVRKEFTLPPVYAGKNLELQAGCIDDFDTTYFNGVQVGKMDRDSFYAYQTPRVYKIPGSLVKTGKNVVAIRIVDDLFFGGIHAADICLVPTGKNVPPAVSIKGPWKVNVELQFQPVHRELAKPQPPDTSGAPNTPTTLYNAMIHPLTPFAIRGAIWYQGENNAGKGYEYRSLFPALIQGWRKAWDEGDFPFYFVQLANFMAVKPEPSESGWAELREAQFLTLKLNNTGMAVIIDIGDAGDIHPKNKQDVGKRLAQWALAKTYGQKKVVFSGPLYKSMKVKGDKIQIEFDCVGGGLVAKGDNLTGFAIAGTDRKFVWAQAKIEGDRVIVWSDKVGKPVAVRYAWADNPVCNLYNKADLPACPFRTDE
jgi:sialate O-acetylesterase